jgi:signal transduction histidine kinase
MVFAERRTACFYHDQGPGTGLAIVAKGMQWMNGRVSVESQVGQGSQFWLDFPI